MPPNSKKAAPAASAAAAPAAAGPETDAACAAASTRTAPVRFKTDHAKFIKAVKAAMQQIIDRYLFNGGLDNLLLQKMVDYPRLFHVGFTDAVGATTSGLVELLQAEIGNLYRFWGQMQSRYLFRDPRTQKLLPDLQLEADHGTTTTKKKKKKDEWDETNDVLISGTTAPPTMHEQEVVQVRARLQQLELVAAFFVHEHDRVVEEEDPNLCLQSAGQLFAGGGVGLVLEHAIRCGRMLSRNLHTPEESMSLPMQFWWKLRGEWTTCSQQIHKHPVAQEGRTPFPIPFDWPQSEECTALMRRYAQMMWCNR